MSNAKIKQAYTTNRNVDLVPVKEKPLEQTECFAYLGGEISEIGGAKEDKAPIRKHALPFSL